MLPGPWTSDERSPCRHPRGTAPAILDMRVAPMTDTPRVQATAGEPRSRRAGLALPATRYRHPGDVIRLIAAALVLAVTGTIAALVPSAALRPDAAEVGGTGPGTAAGQVLTGLVQVTIAGAALVLLIAGLRRRRFRVIATVAGGFVAAAALTAVIMYLTGQGALGTLTAGLRRHSWLTGAGFPDPAVIAGLAAVAVAAAPWLSRPWRRTAWADAAADRRGAGDHRGAVTGRPGARGGGRGGRRGRPARRLRGAGPPDGRGGRGRRAAGGRGASQRGDGGECHRQGIAAVPGGNRGRAGPVCEGLRLGSA